MARYLIEFLQVEPNTQHRKTFMIREAAGTREIVAFCHRSYVTLEPYRIVQVYPLPPINNSWGPGFRAPIWSRSGPWPTDASSPA